MDYLNRPFRGEELLARVQNLMTMRQYTRSLEEPLAERTAQLAQIQERIAQQLSDTVVKTI
jgi:DNA-binding response OmpR family regulator